MKKILIIICLVSNKNILAQNFKNDHYVIEQLLGTHSSIDKKRLEYIRINSIRVIPLLIKQIVSDKKLKSHYLDSDRSSFELNESIYRGIIAAKFLEAILYEELSLNICGNLENGYRECKISKNGLGGRQPLKLSDLVIIKNIYQHWWDKNSKTNIQVLRKKNIPFKTILSGSNFHWY
jgi:hypothetical protein